jgi:CDP-diacylglycerol--serine O-phosphatidyltransferase
MITNRFTSQIPGLFISLNLFAGSAAIFLASEGKGLLVFAGYFIIAAAFFDMLDSLGFRKVGPRYDIHKEFDSLAHLVSFAIAPSVILFKMIKIALKVEAFSLSLPFTDILILLSPLFIVIFSAWRLAKTNIDRKQKDSYIGMPTPINAIVIASLPLIVDFSGHYLLFPELNYETWYLLIVIGMTVTINSSIFLISLIVIQSILLISNIRMFSLRLRGLAFSDKTLRILFFIISLGLFTLFQPASIPMIFILFLLFSLVSTMILRIVKRFSKDSQYTETELIQP